MKHTGAYQVKSGSSAAAIAIGHKVLNLDVPAQLAFPGQMSLKGAPNIEFLLLGAPSRISMLVANIPFLAAWFNQHAYDFIISLRNASK